MLSTKHLVPGRRCGADEETSQVESLRGSEHNFVFLLCSVAQADAASRLEKMSHRHTGIVIDFAAAAGLRATGFFAEVSGRDPYIRAMFEASNPLLAGRRAGGNRRLFRSAIARRAGADAVIVAGTAEPFRLFLVGRQHVRVPATSMARSGSVRLAAPTTVATACLAHRGSIRTA